ncbi:MAG: ArsR family transcriptional regulator [Proteobacteria bacterium]|nr:ArsR family transcriptional regulator [Pseudomonadota bacterium]
MSTAEPSVLRQVAAEDRRLRILQALEWSNGYTSNASLLKELLKTVGHVTSTHVLAADLAWLEDVELIRLTKQEAFSVVKLTAAGLDVVQDARLLPGVARPDPEDSPFRR